MWWKMHWKCVAMYFNPLATLSNALLLFSNALATFPNALATFDNALKLVEQRIAIFITYILCVNRSFWLSRNKKIENHPVENVIVILWKMEDKKNKTLLQVLGLCVSPNFRYASKCFPEIYRTQYKNACCVLRVTSIWRPENIVDIYTYNLLWLSRQLIISTEQPTIYISTFPCTLTSNHAVSTYIFQQTLS